MRICVIVDSYGTVLGLAFATVAIFNCLDYLRNYQVRKAIIALLFIMLAILVKNNYLIWGIGMFIV